jgi:flagellar biosynthesis protein FliQ
MTGQKLMLLVSFIVSLQVTTDMAILSIYNYTLQLVPAIVAKIVI